MGRNGERDERGGDDCTEFIKIRNNRPIPKQEAAFIVSRKDYPPYEWPIRSSVVAIAIQYGHHTLNTTCSKKFPDYI